MSTPILRKEITTSAPAGNLFKYSNTKIKVPCAVVIDNLSEENVVDLVMKLQSNINGKLFRDIGLFMDVYSDHKQATESQFNHVCLCLTLRADGDIRISTSNQPFADGGATFYDIEQLNLLLDHL